MATTLFNNKAMISKSEILKKQAAAFLDNASLIMDCLC